MEYYSAIKRNAPESALMRCMNPEPVTQSKVRKRETNIAYSHIHRRSRRMVLTNLCTEPQWRCGHKRTNLWARVGRRGRGRDERRARRGCTHTSTRQPTANGNSLQDSGSCPGAREQPRAAGAGGRQIPEGGHKCKPTSVHVNVRQKSSGYYRPIISQINKYINIYKKHNQYRDEPS